MAAKKISGINDELDIKLFLYIAKKNIIYVIVFLTISLTAAYLYLRYTHPLYQARAIIQISSDNPNPQISKDYSTLYTDNLSKKIEILRSMTFLTRAFSLLPMDINYFSKGTVLNFEQYKSSPFEIEAKVKDPIIYGIPIYINFLGKNKYSISYYIINEASREKEFFITEKAEFPEVELSVKLVDRNLVDNKQGIFNQNQYFFVLNNPDFLVQTNISSLGISILDPNAQTIQIIYTAKSPYKTADVVNTIASEFQKYDVEVKSQSAYKVLKYIDDQLKTTYDTLSELENKISTFKKEHGLDTINLLKIPRINDKISKLEDDVEKIELQDKYLDEFERNLSGNIDIDIFKLLTITSDNEYKSSLLGLSSSLNSLLLQRENLKRTYTTNSNAISSLDFQIELQKKIIIENIKNIRKNLFTDKETLNKNLEIYKKVTEPGDNSEQMGFFLFELRKIERVYSITSNYLEKLIDAKAQYSIAKAGYVSQNVILETSKVPTIPISPNKNFAYIVSIIIGTIISLALIVIKYLLYNEITSLNDISKYTDAPILGIIPNYKKVIPVSQLIIDKKPKSMMAECLRAIRTNLQFISSEPGPKVISITSTISREGKTFFAINLAGIIAFSDKKVLIIDFDMRKPKIHVGFDSENTKGVSTILVGKDSPEDCIENTEFSNLDYITAGPTPPNPSELILNKRMDALIQYLKTKYDFIIIDSPPIGVVTDAMKPIQMADYPIYIMKANYSKRIFIQNILKLINENNIKKLSIVLNQIEPQYSTYGYKGYGYGGMGGGSSYGYGGYGYGYGYGFGYGYGYGYGYYEEDEEREDKPKESMFSNLFKSKKKKS